MRSFLVWLFVDLIWANIFWVLGIGAGLIVLMIIAEQFMPAPEESDAGTGGEDEGLLGGLDASDARNLAPSASDFASDEDEDGSEWIDDLDL